MKMNEIRVLDWSDGTLINEYAITDVVVCPKCGQGQLVKHNSDQVIDKCCVCGNPIDANQSYYSKILNLIYNNNKDNFNQGVVYVQYQRSSCY